MADEDLFEEEVLDVQVGEGEVDLQKKKKPYFTSRRISLLFLWVICVSFVPYLAILTGVLPEGTGFVAVSLVLTSVFAILFDKSSFRVGVFLVVFLAAFSLYKPAFVSELLYSLNNRMQEAFFQIRGPIKNSRQVVIVDIDQRSFEAIGQWPWPRSIIARFNRVLIEDGVRVIGYDIVFAEPGRYGLHKWLTRINDMGVDLRMPKMTSAESEELMEEEGWGFTIPGDKLKEIVLLGWQRRFESEDEDLDFEEIEKEKYESFLIAKFLENDERLWNEDQDKLKQRAVNAGSDYVVKPYIPPDEPLLAMGRQSNELFYVSSSWDDLAVFEKGADVITNNDVDFAESFTEGPVVAGGFFILDQHAGRSTEESTVETEGMVVSSSVRNADRVFHFLQGAKQQILNVDTLQEKIMYQGMFNVVPDKSGSAHHYKMLLNGPIYQETLVPKEELGELTAEQRLDMDNYDIKIVSQYVPYPSISLEMLRVANGFDYVEALETIEGTTGLKLKRTDDGDFPGVMTKEDFPELMNEEVFIPLDFKGDIRINYLGFGNQWVPGNETGPEYHFPYVSLSDVIHKRFEPGFFKNKYVIIGSTDPTLSDLIGSPFRAAFPGLEVHATMLDNLITQNYLIDLGDRSTLYIFFGILILGVLLSAAVAYASVHVASICMAVVMIALPGWSYWQFSVHNTVIEFIYPWLCTAFIGAIIILVNFFIEGREKRFLNNTFKNYLSPELIDQMIESGTTPTLGGQEGFLTAFFTDMASFSTISEKLGSPTKLVELLNEYLSEMTDILVDNGGTLDKYEGDAIIAFFGAPMPLKNHAYSACITALRMQQALANLRTKWASEGEKWPVNVHHAVKRIGINSGMIVTGNMGSAMRMNYTMMGDSVNLAARLESGAKQYGVYTMLSKESFDAAGGDDAFLCRFIDRIRVVGKSEPVVVYELLEEIEQASPDLIKLRDTFLEARGLYDQMKWDEAKALFEQCLDLEPHPKNGISSWTTTPSDVFIERCIGYKEHPPVPEGEEWDGVYTATDK